MYFPVTTHGLHMLSGAYLNKFTELWCPVTENSSIYWFHQIRCFP